MTKIDFKAEAQALRDDVVAWRRDFHMHPELAFEEVRTAGIVAETLNDLGMEVQTGVGKTGVIGILEGSEDGPTVLYRADMDALPIHEANETDYISQTPGKMHACGHDGHTAIALGVAKLFAKHRENLSGRIKFVFQPAEEVVGGAKAMVADGALTNPRPDFALGLHLANDMPVGNLGVADGPVMACGAILNIVVEGKGGHGAMPHQTHDPIVCAAQIVTALQSIVSRNTGPLETLVVSVTRFHAGSANNIIPASVEMGGTIRAYKDEVRAHAAQRVTEIAEGIAASMGCKATVEIENTIEVVENNPEVSETVRNAFRKQGYGEDNFQYRRTTGSEDVGEFMKDIPGMYFFLGSADPSRELDFPHHHPRFDFDEDALSTGVELMSAALAAYVVSDEA
ncbi:MAG: M20 metallopeptidase family protein [Aggregatilineales bacterium]